MVKMSVTQTKKKKKNINWNIFAHTYLISERFNRENIDLLKKYIPLNL